MNDRRNDDPRDWPRNLHHVVRNTVRDHLPSLRDQVAEYLVIAEPVNREQDTRYMLALAVY